MLRLLVAASLVLAFSAVVPTANARIDPCATTACTMWHPGVCTEGHAPCPSGELACATLNGQVVACVWDPCATANCFNFGTSTSKCVAAAHQTVCVYPDEPSYVECVSVNGKPPVCIVDPCGTTACF